MAAANILGAAEGHADYAAVPRVVYTDPQATAVGEAEGALTRRSPLSRSHAPRPTRARTEERPGFLAGVRRGAHRRVRAGPEAGEWLGQATVAIRAQVPLAVLNDVIQPFPTFSEAFLFALQKLSPGVPAAA